MTAKVMIKIEDLAGGYGDNLILNRVSLEIYEGEIFIILGASGCGKSTLMKHMIGLIEPGEGRVII
ncbi:MAG TPA: ATP-binding cassette domain-containing protein, partial [Desulfobacteraceae bacterium]|nr:ATP-binding cassette domain-containing protein [Desulfobacteraceae bacterium]